MVLTMSSEKQSVEVPTTAVVLTQDVSPKKSRFTKKQLIVAGTTVLVLVLVIVGVLVGVKFFLDSTNKMVERSFEFAKEGSNEKDKEDVSADVTQNLVTYHRKDNDDEIWVISDYNREIEIMKTNTATATGYTCYVTPRNASDSSTPKAFEDATSPTSAVDTVWRYYDISSKPINEKSMLGTSGQTLCDGIDVFWLTPSCEKSANAPAARDKRSICVIKCIPFLVCNSKCVWQNTCYYSC